jgi:hypothetical protein
MIRGDITAVEECFENVRASDYYVLLIGNRRGAEYSKGVSVTRQEYRVAVEALDASGSRPRMLLYIRQASLDALRAGGEALDGIEDPDHLKEFVDEVEERFLKRFRSFGDLKEAVFGSLNLGRGLAESLTRHALVSELTWNLSNLTMRIQRSGAPHHWWMAPMRENFALPGTYSDDSISIPQEYFFGLSSSMLEAATMKKLRSSAIEDALATGVFLDYDPVSNSPSPTPIHTALGQLLDDITALEGLIGDKEWAREIEFSLGDALKREAATCNVMRSNLLFAYAFHDRYENVFTGHVELSKAFLGVVSELRILQRTPISPIGERESYNIQRERVTPREIRHLLVNEVAPFGDKVQPEAYGDSRDQQIDTMAEKLRHDYKKMRVPSQFPPWKSSSALLSLLLTD